MVLLVLLFCAFLPFSSASPPLTCLPSSLFCLLLPVTCPPSSLLLSLSSSRLWYSSSILCALFPPVLAPSPGPRSDGMAHVVLGAGQEGQCEMVKTFPLGNTLSYKNLTGTWGGYLLALLSRLETHLGGCLSPLFA